MTKTEITKILLEYDSGEISTDKAIEKLSDLLSTAGWISIKDKSPKPSTVVLICDGLFRIHVSFYDGARKFTHPYYENFNNVTHWRPLPDLPAL